MSAAHAVRDSGTCHAMVYRRAVILVVLCIALAAAASSSALHDALLGVLDATQDVIARHVLLGIAAFVVLAAVSAMFAFVSIAIVVPAAVVAWGAPASIGMLWLGWILGGVATYSIGRFLGRRVVHWLTADEALRKLEAGVRADTPVWSITLLQLALPSEIPGYVLGLLRYPFARFVLALGLAELPYTVATVYLGKTFVEGRSALMFVLGVLIAFCTLATYAAFHRFVTSAPRP